MRHEMHTAAIIERRIGEPIAASTVNVSGSGVLLALEQPSDLSVGDEVGCSIELYAGKPPQGWGVGKVVRVDDDCVAIEFNALDWGE